MYFTISGDDAVARRRRRRRSRPRGADGVGLQHVVQEEPREDPGRVLSMRAPRQRRTPTAHWTQTHRRRDEQPWPVQSMIKSKF